MLHLLVHETGHALAVHADFEKIKICIFGTGNVDEHRMQPIGGYNPGSGGPKVIVEPAIQFAGIGIIHDSVRQQRGAIREIQPVPGIVVHGLAVN